MEVTIETIEIIIGTLASVVAVLFKIHIDSNGKRMDACDEDRRRLWERINTLESKIDEISSRTIDCFSNMKGKV